MHRKTLEMSLFEFYVCLGLCVAIFASVVIGQPKFGGMFAAVLFNLLLFNYMVLNAESRIKPVIVQKQKPKNGPLDSVWYANHADEEYRM